MKKSIDLEIGLNVTELLGVTKYDPPLPACLGGVAIGNFPSHSIRTDEERLQNLSEELYQNYHDNYTWIATEKLDGSSFSAFIYDNKFGIASRNLQLKEDEKNSFWKYARKNNLEEKMRDYMKDNDLTSLTLQGELIGSGIQKNKYKLKGQEVRFFRSFDPIAYEFCPYEVFIEDMKAYGLKSVPIIERNMILPDTIEELILMADGRSTLYDTAREGIVFVAESVIEKNARPLEDYQGRLSFKVISNKFILKHEE